MNTISEEKGKETREACTSGKFTDSTQEKGKKLLTRDVTSLLFIQTDHQEKGGGGKPPPVTRGGA